MYIGRFNICSVNYKERVSIADDFSKLYLNRISKLGMKYNFETG